MENRTSFGIEFYCKQSRAGKDGKAMVELALSLNGERKFISIPLKCDVKDFNRKRRPKEIEMLLEDWRNRINSLMSELAVEGIPLTVENIREYLRSGGIKPYTVEDCFNDFLSINRKRVGVDLTRGAFRKYELLRDNFYRFIDKRRDIRTITPTVMKEWYSHLKSLYPNPQTNAPMMQKTKTVFKTAIDEGKIRHNPFQGIIIHKAKPNIEYLTENELKKIENTTYSSPCLERVKDCFLMQAYSGLSYIDMEQLSKEDIKQTKEGQYYIQKPRQKTKIEFTAVLLPKAIEILEKYDYNLPRISNQKYNYFLKVVALEAGITKNLKTHLGRKTYGTMLCTMGIRMEIIAKCLGHSNARTTATYYAKVQTDTIVNEVARAFS